MSAFAAQLDLLPIDDNGLGDLALALTLPCWTLLGMLDRAMDLTRTHIQLREQFGAPLARLQGVQFQLTEAEAAFRFMAQARHVGKLVLVPPRTVRADGTVLITGGLGALGAHVARWVVGRGAKHVVLAGRRGIGTPGGHALVEERLHLAAKRRVGADSRQKRLALLGRARERGLVEREELSPALGCHSGVHCLRNETQRRSLFRQRDS